MRLPATNAPKGILVGILTGAVVATALTSPNVETSDVIVRGADLGDVVAAVQAYGGTVELEIGLIDAVSAEVPVDLVDDLEADGRTLEVTADAQVQLLSLSTDVALTDDAVTVLEPTTDVVLQPVTAPAPATTGMTPDAAARVLGGVDMRENGFDGSGIDVALVDSGVDASAVSRVQHAIDLSFSTSSARDGYGHGTAMAGVIAGVAPAARIVDVKVADDRGVADVSQVLAGIDWTVTNRNTDGRNIRVMSLSFGTDGTNPASTSPLAYAVEAAWRHGITVAVAAGNHGNELGRLMTPAISPNVIAVGAADVRHVSGVDGLGKATVPTWSAVGDGRRNPDVIAPGRSILGGLAPNSAIASGNPQAVVEGSLLGSGTSQATAFTAGVIANLLEARSNLTPNEVKALVMGATRAVDAPSAQAGRGVINLEALFAPGNLSGRIKGIQRNSWSSGTGTLDGDRGRFILQDANGNLLTGQNTPVGPFNGSTWTGSTWTGSTWTGSTWTGSTWTGSTWTGSTWTGSTWTGSTWTGSTWTNVRWGQ